MKNLTTMLLIIIALIGCKDDLIKEAYETGVDRPKESSSCNSQQSFLGIKDVTEILDISAKLNWDKGTNALGHSIFELNESGKLKFIASISKEQTSYTIKHLQALTRYEFMVKSISSTGLHDCNKKSLKFTTSERQTFKSCFDIKEYYGDNLDSGIYQITVDLEGSSQELDVFCEMNLSEGGWTRVFLHRTSSGLFTSKQQAISNNKNAPNSDSYSILSLLENFKRDQKYEFWIYYPEIDNAGEGNHWSQTSNPVEESISGYQSINIFHNGHHWGGLEPGVSSTTLIDGSVGHNNWYYSIGSYRYWPSNGKIPGPENGVREVILYVK